MDKVKNLNEDKKDAKNTRKETQARPFMTPPAGRPMPKNMVVAPNGKVMPQGKPMPKNAVPQMKSKPKDEEAEGVRSAVAGQPQMPEPAQPKEAGEAKTAREHKEAAAKEAATVAVEKTAVAAKEGAAKEDVAEAKKEPAPKKEPANDYVDRGPTLKIIKRAVDIEKEKQAEKEAREKAASERAAAKASEKSARTSTDRAAGKRPERAGRTDRGDKNDRGEKKPWQKGEGRPQDGRSGDRSKKPADRNDRGVRGKDKDGDDRRGDRRTGGDAKKKSVLVYDAPLSIAKPSKKSKEKEKEKERDRVGGEKKRGKVMDLTKAAPKKHKKNKDKAVEQVVENAVEMEALPVGTKVITVPITVAGLSEQIEVSTSQIIMSLMKLGIMANINQNLDEDTALLLGEELGVSIVVSKVNEEEKEEGLELFEDKEEDLKARPPIITVMGHVDHGKTSLLDAIRKTNVTDQEAGGITQHIGASEVNLNGQKIVFLDTPGHEAFTAMRARGALITDIAILVVAADDSVKPQTIESISHAKAAGVPIIVAINKVDKPGANPDKVKQDLTEHGILVEDWGGDTICVPVSAKTGEGIVNLLEMVLLQAEVLELKANPNRLAMGTVIEARLDKAKGPVATLLITNGTLQAGMSVVAGTCSGKIRAMTNYKGDAIRKAGPATAVEILGLTEVPEAGDEFNALKEDRLAREIAEKRRVKLREEVMARNASVTLEQLFSQIAEGEVKELNLIIKADVQGSVGALTQSLEKLQTENVKVKIVHSGVGTVTESDIMLASTSHAIIIGFNVRPSTPITAMADREGVEIRTYRIIYEVLDDIEAAMKGMLDPVFKEVVLGKIEIRETFKVPGVGIIGGAYVLEGKVQRNAQIRLVRDGIVVHEGKISSLKRYKDDAKEVAQGFECGIGIENYNDVKEGDIIEAFKMEEVERK